MSLPWSSKGLKVTPVAADELLILDSEDAVLSTKNKRVTLGSLPANEVLTWTANHDAAGFDLLNVGGIQISNPADTFQYIVTPTAIAADRILNLPLMTGTDTLVLESFAATLTNKTITAAANTLTIASTDLTDTANIAYLNTTNTFGSGLTQIFTHAAGGAGIELAPVAGDVTAPGNGQFWYNLTTNKFRVRENGVTTDMIKPGEIFTWTADHDAAGFDLLNVGGITISNPADTFQYIVTPAALAADRILNLPLMTGTDTVVLEAFAATLTNKTIAAGSNTITGITNTALTSGVFSAITGLGTQTQALDMGTTNKIVNLAEPTLAQDSATKNYVDSFVQGTVKWKEPVTVATTGSNITLSAEQTIDGVLTSTDRILVKDQTLGQENGIYVTAAGAWSRAIDFDASDEIVNAAMWVSEGTANADQAFVCTTDAPIVVGTTVLTFVQFSGLGQITAGTNLSKTGNTLDFDPTGGVDMLANALTAMGILSFSDVSTSIQQATADLQLDVATGGAIVVRVNNIAEYDFDATQADFLANNIRNVGFFESAATTPADAGAARFGNNEFITWRDTGNTRNARLGLTTGDDLQLDQVDFEINARNDESVNFTLVSNYQTPIAGNNLCNIAVRGFNSVSSDINFAEIDVNARVVTNGSEVGEIRFVAVNQDTGPGDPLLAINELGVTGVHILNAPLYFTSSSTFPDNAVIIFNNGGGMNLNVVDTGFDFVIGSTFEYFFGPTSSDWSSNSLIDVGLLRQRLSNSTAVFEMEANHTTPANAQVIGQIDFIDDSSTGVRRTYSEIRGLIEDPTNLGEDGEMFLSVIKAGTLTDYLAINQANDGNITLLQNIEIADATDIILNATTGTKIGTATSQKLGFFNATPVIQPTVLTAALTTLTNAGTASDFAIQALTNTGPFGFVTQAEGETVVEVVLNNQARINEIETKLQALGLLA